MMHRTMRACTATLVIGIASILLFNSHNARSRGRVIVLDPARTGARPIAEVVVSRSDVDAIQFTVNVNAVEIQTTDNALEAIEFEGAQVNGEVGAPAIPVIRRAFAVPKCESVELQVTRTNEITIPDIDLAIVEQVVSENLTRAVPLRAEYQRDAAYPQSDGKVVSVGSMRGQQIAIVELYPVRHNPRTREASVASSMSVTLRPVKPTGPVFINSGPMQDIIETVLTNSSRYDGPAQVKDPRVSFDPGNVCWCDGASISAVAAEVAACEADYLIIAAEELATPSTSHDLIEDLADRRASYNGFNVAIVSMADIDASVTSADNDTPQKIRDLIKQVYDSESAEHMGDERLGYVLLLGDARNPSGDWLIPGNSIVGGGGWEENNDALYAMVDTNNPNTDQFPDLLLGRLPVDADETDTELTNVKEKIIDYEPLPDGPAWVDKTVWISGGDPSGFGSGTGNPFQGIFDEFEEDLIPPSVAVRKMHLIGNGLTNHQFSGAAVDTLEEGARTAILLDHGFYWYMAKRSGDSGPGGSFNPDDYDSMDGIAPPVIMALCSYLGAFDNTTQCETTLMDPCDVLCERLVLQPSGSIASVGYCRTTSTTNAYRDAQHLLQAIYQYREPDLGRIVTVAKLLDTIQGAFTDGYVEARRITLFGDPALNIQWRDTSHDNVDLAVTPMDIEGDPLAGGNLPDAGTLHVTVRNHGADVAEDFVVEVWDGDPDDAGELIDDVPVESLPGHGTTSINVSYNLPRSTHTIHVVVDPDSLYDDPVRENNHASRRFDMLTEKAGFPSLKSAAAFRSTVIADVAPSSGKEILVVMGATDLACYPASGGNAIWSRPSTSNTSLLVGSLDMDGHANIIREGSTSGACPPCPVHAYALNAANGAVIDSFSVGNFLDNMSRNANSTWGAQSYWIGDLVSGNSVMEVVTVKGNGIAAYNRHGGVVWEKTLSAANLGECSVAIGDIDFDGDVEVALARWDSVAVFGGQNGQSLWRRRVVDNAGLLDASYIPRVCLSDLDGNGSVEIVTTGITSGDSRLATWSNTGTQLNSVAVGDFVPQGGISLAAADVNGSAGTEIVALTDTTLAVYDDDLALLNSYNPDEGTRFLPTILLADTDNDGDCEIICPATSNSDHPLLLIPETTVQLLQLSHTLALQENVVVSRSTNFLNFSAPAIDDIDGDGQLEVVFLGHDKCLHAIEVGTTARKVPWGSNHGDLMATRLSEQPIKGTYAKKLSLFNRCRVIDDATFQDDLFIDGSADVVVNASPLGSGGYAPTKCELFVQDPLKIQGWTTKKALFTSSSGAMNSWGGFWIEDDAGAATVDGCSLEDAGTAITTYRDFNLENAIFENNSFGVVVGGEVSAIEQSTFYDNDVGAASSGGTMRLKHSIFSSNSTFDVIGGQLAETDIDTCQFDTSPYGLYGYGETYVTGCTFDGASTMAVLLTSTYAEGLVQGSEFDDCPIAIQTTGLGTSKQITLRGNNIDDSSTAGIKSVGANGTVTLRQNQITGSAVGVLADGSDAQVRAGNHLEDNTIGVKCINSAAAVVESTTVFANTTGIEISSNSNADCGHASGGQSVGYNAITDSSPYHIKNLHTGLTIKAENNWWDGEPQAGNFSGSVDARPYLDELFFVNRDPDEKLPTKFALGRAVPNPFNPSTTISYDIPAGGGNVAINVFDVAGRRVATLMDGHAPAGTHTVAWDGHDSRGAGVASGIYFVQMRAPAVVLTQKIVLLK